MSPWHEKDPDAQTTWRSQDQIPGTGLFPWQQGLTGAGSQREQSVLAQAQPVSPFRERQAAQLGGSQWKRKAQTPARWGRREEQLHHKV